jgi:hypothetical protein
MLQSCFTTPKNAPGRKPKATEITAPLLGAGFEARAFSALWSHRAKLGITRIFRCSAARVDGYLETATGETILLEMKESLSWGSTEAAGFQFLAGQSLLSKYFAAPPRRGIIVFERKAKQWESTGPYGALGQLALEAAAVANHIEIGALQLGSNGSLHTYTNSAP